MPLCCGAHLTLVCAMVDGGGTRSTFSWRVGSEGVNDGDDHGFFVEALSEEAQERVAHGLTDLARVVARLVREASDGLGGILTGLIDEGVVFAEEAALEEIGHPGEVARVEIEDSMDDDEAGVSEFFAIAQLSVLDVTAAGVSAIDEDASDVNAVHDAHVVMGELKHIAIFDEDGVRDLEELAQIGVLFAHVIGAVYGDEVFGSEYCLDLAQKRFGEVMFAGDIFVVVKDRIKI